MLGVKKYFNKKCIYLFYFIFIVFSIFLLSLYSATVKETFLIQLDGTKKEITIPFQNDQFDFQNLYYELAVVSNINQKADISIAVDDIIEKIFINGKELNTEKIKKAYNQTTLNSWKRGYIFKIPLNVGQNNIRILGQNTGGGYTLKFEQKPYFWIWMVLFLSMGLPLSHLFVILVKFLNKFVFVWKRTIELQ